AMRTALVSAARGFKAPSAAVDAIKGALELPFDEGSVREREIFADCVVSIESRALRHLFFAEREAPKILGLPADSEAPEVRRAAVVGAGTMGGGIAMAYASAGIPVLLKDVNEGALERGLSNIRRNYESAVAKGRLSADARDRTLALITPTLTFDDFK